MTEKTTKLVAQKTVRYKAKVLRDGHLSPPPKMKLTPGESYSIILAKQSIFDYTADLVKKKKIKKLSLREISKIVHEVRGVKE